MQNCVRKGSDHLIAIIDGFNIICRYLKYISEGKEFPAIILAPQCPQGVVWNNLIFALKELIDNVIESYNVDKNKVSITGISK